MPPTEAAIEKALEAFGRIRLESFSTDPASVLAGNPVELRWRVSGVQAPVSVHLNGVRVQPSGTQTVTPFRPTSYSLEASGAGIRQVLGSVQIAVDLTGCSVHSIPESELRTQIRSTLEQQFPSHDGRLIKINNGPNVRVRVRNDHTIVRVGVDGLRIAGELGAEVNNAPDGTITFDATVALGAENGRATHKIVQFHSDFDFDDKLDFFSAGLFKLLDQIIDASMGERVKAELDQAIAQLLAAQVSLLAATQCELVSVSPAVRRIDFTLCPGAEGADCARALLRRMIRTEASHGDSSITL